tara:strand:+ start:493 stop:705 length:213 start_codon:yes stop_codon:yes gene_type:complete
METNAIHNYYKEQYKEFLDDLSDSGETNMLGAGSYLIEEYGLEKQEARRIIAWYLSLYNEYGRRKIEIRI